MAKMNLTEYAEWQGVSFKTAQRWFHGGKMPYPAERIGRQIFIDVPDERSEPQRVQRTALYLGQKRGSAADVREWALGHGLRIDETHREPSAENPTSVLKKLLADPAITRIITDSHPAADLLSAALSATGREFITTTPQTQTPARTFKPRLASSAGA